MADDTSKPPAQSSRDFMQWGRSFLKDAMSRANSVAVKQTRPLDAPAIDRRRTTLLEEEIATVMGSPRASVSDLARLRIVLADNFKRALYPPLAAADAPFSVETERQILERAIAALREVADRLSAVGDLVPRGRYAGMTLAQVIEGVSARDLRAFFYFLKERPEAFVGKPLRFAEVFVAWVIDHGEAEVSPAG